MKQIVATLAACAVLTFAGASWAAEGLKIASVDLRKVAIESKEGRKVSEDLNRMKEKMVSGLRTKEAEFKKYLESTEAKAKKMSEKEKTAKKKEAQKKYEALQEAAEKVQLELQAKDDEYSRKIQAGIEKTAKDYAVKNGYALVIRKGDLVYTDGKNEVKDVTDEILKLYDNSAQPEPSK